MEEKKKRKPNGYWTKEIIFEEAKKYKTKTEFHNKNSKAYNWARKNKIFNEACSHMVRPLRKLKWTKEKIHKEALKYKTKTEFQNANHSAYNAGYNLNIIEIICSHMELKHKRWTVEEIKKESEKYKSRIEFLKKGSAAYQSAKRKKILDIVCEHMVALKTLNGYWTKERVLKEALKHETRTNFQKESKGAYSAALKKGILEEACSHMEFQNSYYKRAIYIIKFPKINSCYVGLTYNYKIRKRSHLIKKTNKNLTKLFKNKEEHIWEYENVWYNVSEARKRECEIMEQKKIEGWKLLNIAKGGALGGNIIKWTKEKIFKEAKKYTIKSDFHKKSSGAYRAAKTLGIFEKACEHMILLKKYNNHWTKNKIKEEALKYKSKTNFAKNCGSAYNKAKKLGIYEEIIKHMDLKKMPNGYWTKKRALKVAKKCKTKNEFRKKYNAAVRVVEKFGIYNEATKHMKNKKKLNGYWTEEKIIKIAKSCKNATEFIRDNSGAYVATKRLGIYNKIKKLFK